MNENVSQIFFDMTFVAKVHLCGCVLMYLIVYCNATFLYFFKKGCASCLFQSVLAKKKHPVDRTLEHFDDFYKTVFGRRWPSIRLALLSPHKYCAVINNFGDSDIAVSNLQVI